MSNLTYVKVYVDTLIVLFWEMLNRAIPYTNKQAMFDFTSMKYAGYGEHQRGSCP